MSDDDKIDLLVELFPRLFRGQRPVIPSDLSYGWSFLVSRMLVDINGMLDDVQAERFEVRQIKEKFGTLRFYWRLGDEQTRVVDIHGPGPLQRMDIDPVNPEPIFGRIRARVDMAEVESGHTCEQCGDGNAKRRNMGWLTTLCDSCFELRTFGEQ